MATANDEVYMQRCLDLAALAGGRVRPNPMVGAVLVHEDRIIGEGYHEIYGGPHAEVNCLSAVSPADRHLISASTLYVSLEPCAHYGKTPPCTELVLQHRIGRVVIGCRDPFKEVDGKGIERLAAAGVNLRVGVLEEACRDLNRRFFTFHVRHRPYIVLKWARTADGKMAAAAGAGRLLVSNDDSNRLVHKWRSEEAAILVGTRTALLDNPSLTTRLWKGPSPIRLIVDMRLELPDSLSVFRPDTPVVVFNTVRHEQLGNRLYYQVTHDVSLVHQIANALRVLNIQSVLVEGGARLLQSFIDEDLWDEVRIITNTALVAGEGLPAPSLPALGRHEQRSLQSDLVERYDRWRETNT